MELELLEQDAEIYKLIGPVLVKQERNEAKSNVKKRLDFITGELKRLETTIQDLDKKQEEKKKKVIELQTALQQQQQQSQLKMAQK